MELVAFPNVEECAGKYFHGGIGRRSVQTTRTNDVTVHRNRARLLPRTVEWVPSHRPERARNSATPHAKHSGVQECAEMESEPEASHEVEEKCLALEEEFDNDEVLALEGYVAATEGDMSMANWTWAEARLF